MLETKDPAIKLFGMKIPFPTILEVTTDEEEEEKVLILFVLETSIEKISFGVLKSGFFFFF